MNVLVIDAGTSSMRGILFSEKGRRLLSSQVKYGPVHKGDGWVEQPAEDWEEALKTVVGKLVGDGNVIGERIDMVSVTAQRSSVIPLDKGGIPIMPALMWQDSRNTDICRRLEEENAKIFSRSGARVNTVFSGGKMAWIKEEKAEIYGRIYKFVNVPEYLMYLMTDSYCTDDTYGSRSNLMNLKERKWDTVLLDLFGVEEEKLCRLYAPGSIVGKVTGSFSAETGLKSGIPVVSAGGDQQCAALGQGIYEEGKASVVTGTGAFLVAPCKKIPEDLSPNLICNCSGLVGEYILEANALTCCSAFDWFSSNFYDGNGLSYERMNRELEELYNKEESCLALPYFQGRSTSQWNMQARAVFSNITLFTKRQNMLKALMEGIFMEIRNNMEVLRDYTPIDAVSISGGLTNSTVMNQMQADVYGIPLYQMENAESTALGALMVTLVGQGIYPSAGEAFAEIRGGDSMYRYNPHEKKKTEYEAKREKMNQLYYKVYHEHEENEG